MLATTVTTTTSPSSSSSTTSKTTSPPTSTTTTVAAATTTSSSSSTTTNTTNTSDAADKFKKFENEGVVFKAKLIGSELVMEPRGDKMCQNSIQRLKAIIKGTNSHKKRIVLKISYDGVKVLDEKTNEILHHHEVSQISYIASDETDNRSFGYVSDVPNKAHQFICFKTSGPAINVMSVLSALFEAVQEKTKQAEKSKTLEGGLMKELLTASTESATATTKLQQDSTDLIGGDSGILDIDGSLISSVGNDDKSPISQHLPASFHHHHPLATQQQQYQHHQNHQYQPLQHASSSLLDNSLVASPSNSFSSMTGGGGDGNLSDRLNKQSASSDLIFSDLFSGLSDPIIVDKNDSLISYKPEYNNTTSTAATATASSLAAATASSSTSLHQHHQALGGSMNAGIGLSSSGFGGIPFSIPPPLQQRSLSMANSSGSTNASARPIPRRQNSTQQQQHHSVILAPPSSLPRPAPMMMSSSGPASHNRSLVYNHSSVSLSDAALTQHHHQSSFNSNTSSMNATATTIPNQNNINTTATQQQQQQQNDSYVDRYAVFNDINNLPSIFESTSLGSVNNISSSGANSNSNANILQQSNIISNNIFSSSTGNANNNNNNRFGSSALLQPTLSSSGGFTGSTNTMMMMGSAQVPTSSSLGTTTSMMMSAMPPNSSFGSNVLSTSNSSTNNNNNSNKMSQPCMFRQTNPFDDDFFA